MTEAFGEWTESEPDVIDADAVDVQQHYETHTASVLPALGKISSAETVGVTDKAGWYIIERTANEGDETFTHEGRPRGLTTDFDYILSDVDRSVYAVTSYNDPSAFKRRRRCRFGDEGGIQWEGIGNPTPEWSDKKAIAAFGDVDLVDELKPLRGDLDETQQQQIEKTLRAYIAAFAELYGDESAVYALDSVGGAYVFGAPAATIPIAEYYADDKDARSRVMEAFVDRSNDFLKDKQSEIEEDIEFAEEVIDPDWCNNVNRQYKAPLSLHADHDAVVTPTNTDATGGVDYSVTWVEDVDQETVSQAREWVNEFTSTTHCDRVSDVVESLWPEYFEGDWKRALDQWIEDEREAESKSETPSSDGDFTGGVSDRATTSFEVIRKSLDSLDIEKVAEKYVVHQWTDESSNHKDRSGDGKRAFIPTWGQNATTGNANYVNTAKDSWVDSAKYDHGTVVELALIGRDELDWDRGDIAKGADWVRGVRYLAEDFDEVPELVDDELTAALINHAPDGYDPRVHDDAAMIAWIRARDEGAVPADASPPRRVLRPIVENLVGIDLGTSAKSVGSATWDHAAAVLAELTEDDAIARYDLPVLDPSDGASLESGAESTNSDSSQST